MSVQLENFYNTFPNRVILVRLFHWYAFNVGSLRAVHMPLIRERRAEMRSEATIRKPRSSAALRTQVKSLFLAIFSQFF